MAGGNLGFDANPGGTRLVIVEIFFLVCTWIVSLLRAYVKLFMNRKVLLEDWLMLVALLLYTAYGIIAVYGVIQGGTGKHTADLTVDGISLALQVWYLCEVLYVPIAALIRTSIGLFLLRLVVQSWHIWVIRVNLVVIWLISIVYFFLMMLQCQPISYFWLGPVTPGMEGSCMNPLVVPISTIVHSVLSAVCDWTLGIIPILMLWNVAINVRTKIVIGFLLSMGLVAGIALIVRVPYVKRIAISADFLYETIDLAIWAVLEPSLGIIAGCLASIRPLFKGLGVGLNRGKGYSSKARYGHRPHWYSSSRNMKKLGERSRDSQQPPDSSSSKLELKQHTDAISTKGRHSTRSQGSIWGVEGGRRGTASRAEEGISVQTSIVVVSQRESSATERSSEETRALTRELASHGGVNSPAILPLAVVR